MHGWQARIVQGVLLTGVLLLLAACGEAFTQGALPPTPSPFPTLARQPTVTPMGPTPTTLPTLAPPPPTATPISLPDVLQATSLAEANVREGPGEDFSVIYTIPTTETVQLHKREQGWYQVTLSNEIHGWMSEEVLNVPPEMNQALEMLAANPPMPEKFEGTLVYAANIRTGPGEEHSIIALLAAGETLRVRGRRGDWYLVTLPDYRDGWIIADAFDVPAEVENALPSIQ
jgi:uncharacterized protein YgiM (DUF1202 family)